MITLIGLSSLPAFDAFGCLNILNQALILNNMTISAPTPPRAILIYLSLKGLFTSDLYLHIDPLNKNHTSKYFNYGSLKGRG